MISERAQEKGLTREEYFLRKVESRLYRDGSSVLDEMNQLPSRTGPDYDNLRSELQIYTKLLHEMQDSGFLAHRDGTYRISSGPTASHLYTASAPQEAPLYQPSAPRLSIDSSARWLPPSYDEATLPSYGTVMRLAQNARRKV